MSQLRSFAVAAAFFGVFISLPALTAAQTTQTNRTPVLVELFTSEGCSSCPPADALLAKLDQTQPINGADIIVLGEHVDYWDDLGWKDSFSSHAFTVRQGVYADRLHLASPYTPQMVVDGAYEVLGSDRGRGIQAFEKASALPKISLKISTVKFEAGKIGAHVATGTLPSGAEVFIALALEHAQSQVLRGENGGHRLEHVSVVQNLLSLGKAAKGQAFSKDVNLAASSQQQSYRLIAFVQEPNQGRILGAAMERVAK